MLVYNVIICLRDQLNRVISGKYCDYYLRYAVTEKQPLARYYSRIFLILVPVEVLYFCNYGRLCAVQSNFVLIPYTIYTAGIYRRSRKRRATDDESTRRLSPLAGTPRHSATAHRRCKSAENADEGPSGGRRWLTASRRSSPTGPSRPGSNAESRTSSGRIASMAEVSVPPA